MQPPYRATEPTRIAALSAEAPDNGLLRLRATGEDFSGQIVERIVALPLGPKSGEGAERLLRHGGLGVRVDEGRVYVDDLPFNGAAQAAELDFDWEILAVEIPQDQPSKYWVYPPTLAVLAMLIIWQRRRREREGQHSIPSNP